MVKDGEDLTRITNEELKTFQDRFANGDIILFKWIINIQFARAGLTQLVQERN